MLWLDIQGKEEYIRHCPSPATTLTFSIFFPTFAFHLGYELFQWDIGKADE
jgi:hypothetical protein